MKMKFAALGVAALGLAALPVAGVFAADGDGIMQHEDELRVTVSPVCTLGEINATTGEVLKYNDSTSGTSGTADVANDTTDHGEETGWTNGTTLLDSTSAGLNGYRRDVFAVSMQPGTNDDDVASSIFTIRCNNQKGYTLSATGVTGTIAANELGSNLETSLVAGQLVNINQANKTINTDVIESWDGTKDSYWNFYFTDLATATTGETRTITTGYSTAAEIPTASTAVLTTTGAGDVKDGEKIQVTYGVGVNINQASGTYIGRVHYTLAQAN